MIVKEIGHDDIDDLIELGRAMHQESRYKVLTYQDATVRTLFEAAVEEPDIFCVCLFEKGELVGFLLGFVQRFFFGPANLAKDLALYIKPEKRGAGGARKLVKEFEAWGKRMGAAWIELGVTTGVKEDRTLAFYKSLGYDRLGTLVLKET